MNGHSVSPLSLFVAASLSCAALASAVFAFVGLTSTPQIDEASKAEWHAPFVKPGAARMARPEEIDVQTLARPVFFKSRRPFEPPSPVAATAVAAPSKIETSKVALSPDPGLTVTAVYLFGSTRKALLVAKGAVEGKWLSAGEEIVGWTLADVGPSGATVSNGGQIIDLPLFPYAPKP